MAFRREKYVPRGGPSGGDGGNGGDIYLEANPNDNTLLRYRYNREFHAQRGGHGEGSDCHGRSGEDMVLKVPVGTVVFDANTGVQLLIFPSRVNAFLRHAVAMAGAATVIRRSCALGIRLRESTKTDALARNAIYGSSLNCWPMSAWLASPTPENPL